MSARLGAAAAAATALVVLAGCAATGGTPGSGSAAPDAPLVTGPEAQALLAELPEPSTDDPALAPATLLERDGGTVLCLGAVAESAPPQCDGPALEGWDWSTIEHQETGGVRWAQGVGVPVTYDAGTGVATVAGEPVDLASITMPAIEYPTGDLDEAQLAAMQADMAAVPRADLLGATGLDGVLVVDVLFDDGSIQAALDAIYGPGRAFVVSALRPAP